ncbi:hypothetical protein DSECCO2_501060 [anaerobic digester metagenome]
MAHVGQEFGLRPVGGFGGLLGGQGREFGVFADRDVLAETDDAANFAGILAPGPDLPADPLHGAVAALKGILGGGFDCAGQTAAVDLLPALRNFRKYLVMADADEVPVAQIVVLGPAVTDGDIAHAGVEHGDGGGRVLDEHAQQFLTLGQCPAHPDFLQRLGNGDRQGHGDLLVKRVVASGFVAQTDHADDRAPVFDRHAQKRS